MTQEASVKLYFSDASDILQDKNVEPPLCSINRKHLQTQQRRALEADHPKLSTD
jgi:hypothetical protein